MKTSPSEEMNIDLYGNDQQYKLAVRFFRADVARPAGKNPLLENEAEASPSALKKPVLGIDLFYQHG
jgi:hypothetical protein